MKSHLTKYFILSMLLTWTNSVLAQGSEDVIIRAMSDELDRSMKELKLPNLPGPFFILYGVEDIESYSIDASIGSIEESHHFHNRLKTSTRILAGSYEFNDESLDDDIYSEPAAYDIELPKDDDYWGIRRAFWSTTDNVYRNAAKHFQRHEQTVKESNKTLAETPHRWFAASKPVIMITDEKPYQFDVTKYEDMLRRLSVIFLAEKSINRSGIMMHVQHGYRYLVSSEGTKVKVPFHNTTFAIFAQHKNANGEFTIDQVYHAVTTPDQLPSEQQLTDEVNNLIRNIASLETTPAFEDTYTGPVLMMGPAVANALRSGLLGGMEQLEASDEIEKTTGLKYKNEHKLDNKIGKPLIHENMTVKARPALKTFQGVTLTGSFAIDNEGIVPPDELTLIDKGILKTLMNNRSLTAANQEANGMGRGPGVLEVTTTWTDTEKTLKTKLLEQAKKEGLDYAYIVRNEPMLGVGSTIVYKVSVADGKETMMKHAVIERDGIRLLKHILGASTTYQAYNVPGGARNNDFSLSMIVPSALLFEEMDIKSFSMPTLNQEEYVKSPLELASTK